MKHNKLYKGFNKGIVGGGEGGIYPQGSPFIIINPLTKLLIKLKITLSCPLFSYLDEDFVEDISYRDALILG
jgi:hypothetical protein